MDVKRVDSKWGFAGTPLLPQSLREAWRSEPLLAWIAAELSLPSASSFSALGISVWKAAGTQALTDRQRNFLLNLVQTRRTEIQPLRVFARPVPYWLNWKELPFSTRTRNCLVNGNLLSDSERLSSLTFGDLFEVRSMGVV